VIGAHSVLRRARQNPEKYPWVTQLLARRPFKVVAIQDGARRLGAAGEGWHLSSACARGIVRKRLSDGRTPLLLRDGGEIKSLKTRRGACVNACAAWEEAPMT